jgi:hypothetical protein
VRRDLLSTLYDGVAKWAGGEAKPGASARGRWASLRWCLFNMMRQPEGIKPVDRPSRDGPRPEGRPRQTLWSPRRSEPVSDVAVAAAPSWGAVPEWRGPADSGLPESPLVRKRRLLLLDREADRGDRPANDAPHSSFEEPECAQDA